jgi:uncharacterized membrane protein YdjX (TVP38/TMEM64 family)
MGCFPTRLLDTEPRADSLVIAVVKPPENTLRSIVRPWRLVAVAIIVIVVINLAYGQIDLNALRRAAMELNGGLVFLALVLLPLIGFPVSVLHVFAGVRWGGVVGVSLVTISILLQLLASYGLVHLFRPLFARRLEPLRRRIPEGAHGPVSLFAMLIPGVPYFAKNYVLPLIGVPLPTYLLWCFPLHALRATVPVIFGDQTDHLTPLRIVFFCLYGTVIMLACAWAYRRLRSQLLDPSQAADDPTQNG